MQGEFRLKNFLLTVQSLNF